MRAPSSTSLYIKNVIPMVCVCVCMCVFSCVWLIATPGLYLPGFSIHGIYSQVDILTHLTL